MCRQETVIGWSVDLQNIVGDQVIWSVIAVDADFNDDASNQAIASSTTTTLSLNC